MSLINQMLRDLEERRGRKAAGGTSAEDAVCSAPRGGRRVLIAVCCLVLLGGGLLAGRYLLFSSLAEKRSESPLAAQVEHRPVSVEELVAPANPQVERAQQASNGQADVVQLLSLKLFETDSMARLLLEFSQLPEYGWKETGDEGRKLQIRLRQTSLRSALSTPKPTGSLLEKLQLQSDKNQLLILADGSGGMKLEMFELAADQQHGPRLMLEFYSRAVPDAGKQTVETAQTAPLTPAKPAEKRAPAARMSKSVAPKTVAERAGELYHLALQQLQGKDLAAAEISLLHALSLQPTLLDARMQLYELLQRVGRHAEAAEQLRQALQQDPQNPQLRKLYARYLLDKGQAEEAAAVLLAEPRPAIENDSEYYALLAALQRDLGSYAEAAGLYRELVVLRPQHALWWLGLAISLDQHGDAQQAREAYRQASLLPGLRDDLREYSLQRYEAL